MSTGRALALLVGGSAGVAGACLLSARGVEPFATWLYTTAWYPLLLAMEGAVALRHGRFLLLDRPGAALSVLAWSVPGWMIFEVLNLRLENWYYVFVPEERAALWTGVIVSFATVFPACFLPAALFHPRGAEVGDGGPRDAPEEPPGALEEGPRVAGRPGAGGEATGTAVVASGVLRDVRWSGVLFLVLPLLWPRWFFPLVWGAFALLPEADTARRAPERSLLVDALSGRWRRIGALLAGGAVAGLCWEALNAVARAGWVYTVPGLEEVKLFEMPPLGFLGFPPLALTCFALYQWLVGRGWAVPAGLVPGSPLEESPSPAPPVPDPGEDRRPGRRTGASPFPGPGLAAAAIGGVVVVVGTLIAMERETISSRTPRLRDLPGLLPADVEALNAWGIGSVFDLAEADPGALAGRVPGVDADRGREWIDTARLVTTRGVGTRLARYLHRWGIRSPEELARADPGAVARCFAAVEEVEVRSAQVRVWWRGARAESRAGENRDTDPVSPRCEEGA